MDNFEIANAAYDLRNLIKPYYDQFRKHIYKTNISSEIVTVGDMRRRIINKGIILEIELNFMHTKYVKDRYTRLEKIYVNLNTTSAHSLHIMKSGNAIKNMLKSSLKSVLLGQQLIAIPRRKYFGIMKLLTSSPEEEGNNE